MCLQTQKAWMLLNAEDFFCPEKKTNRSSIENDKSIKKNLLVGHIFQEDTSHFGLW